MNAANPYSVASRAEAQASYAPENETHFVIGPHWSGRGNPTAIGYTSEGEAVTMAARFNAGFVPARCEGCGGFIVEASGVCFECAHPWKPCGTVGCSCNIPKGQRVCMECQRKHRKPPMRPPKRRERLRWQRDPRN